LASSRQNTNSTQRGSANGNPRNQARARTQTTQNAEGVTGQRQARPSATIGQINRERRTAERGEAMRRAAAHARRPFIIAGSILAVVLVCVLTLFVLSKTPVFTIENVSVEGADHLTSAEISALVNVPEGSTLLNVDTDSIYTSLMRDSWVESVSVTRKFPSSLVINVKERQVAAVVDVVVGTAQETQKWAIAKDGMWLMAIPDEASDLGQQLSSQIFEDAQNVLHIEGVPYGVDPEIGTYCTDENVNNALAIVSGMTTDLANQVKKVTATDAESTLLTLDSNVEIAFGTAEDIRDKELVCQEIMEQNPSVVYINVRVVSKPTWRS
jgi:cell division protein FtsQ